MQVLSNLQPPLNIFFLFFILVIFLFRSYCKTSLRESSVTCWWFSQIHQGLTLLLSLGGLLNATCGNATELIIAIFALYQRKVDVVKYSLLGSIISNLLLVLGTSLFCGGIGNMSQEQKYDRKQADVNSQLLLLALLCHMLPLMFNSVGTSETLTSIPTLQLSRASSIIMLITYIAYLFFQLKTHRQFFETQEGMTAVVALLSEYVVGTIEDASNSWGLSVSFISIILLPIVGNAAEHAGAVIFAFKNKLDISIGVALGSTTQIAMFVVPLTVIVAWILGIEMDLDFNLLETGSLGLSILITAFTLQDGTSHYLKGLVLLFCYVVIGACFFVLKTPIVPDTNILNIGGQTSLGGALTA
ncbi:Vacuolar cation/proton exchanger 3 [Ranunculus cassubicifolius]